MIVTASARRTSYSVTQATGLPFAEFPRLTVDVSYSAPTGQTHNPNTSAELTTLLGGGTLDGKTLAYNDTITLDAGTTYTGKFTIPAGLSGSGWVYVVSSAAGSLPAFGTRVDTGDASNMPTVLAPTNQDPAVDVAQGADNFRFVGIRFVASASAMTFTLVNVHPTVTQASHIPQNIIFDRCLFVGDATYGGRRGLWLDSDYGAAVHCYFTGFFDANSGDSQAILVNNCYGPVRIENNFLEAASENINIGGVDPSITDLIPSDLTIRGNHFYKPLAWIGTNKNVKNLLEFKLGRRVLVERNLLENNWLQGQNGQSILITPRNQSGTAPWSITEDITIRYNHVKGVEGGIDVAGTDSDQSSQDTSRIHITHNLFEIENQGEDGYGRCIQVLPNADINTYTLTQNTFVIRTAAFGTAGVMDGAFEVIGATVKNNIIAAGNYGVFGNGTAEGTATFNGYFQAGYDVSYNAFYGTSATYPATNIKPANVTAVKFTDYTNRDYTLASDSPCKGTGSGGADMGCDAATVAVYSAAALNGTAS